MASTTMAGGDRERHVVDGLAGGGGRLGHRLQLLLADVRQVEIGEGGGQADAHAERDELVVLAGRPVLEGELGQGAEVDLLPVHEVVRLGQRGQPVVDGVGRGQAAALEPEPRQQGVGLDHLLQGRGDHVLLAACLAENP
jgi:hypothetical protein